MELIRVGNTDADGVAPLVAAFRTQLKSYKGIKSQPDIDAGKMKSLSLLNPVSRYMQLKTAVSSRAILSAG